MTYKGHIKNGTVIFDEPIQLPEGAAVEIALRLAEPCAALIQYQKSCTDRRRDRAATG